MVEFAMRHKLPFLILSVDSFDRRKKHYVSSTRSLCRKTLTLPRPCSLGHLQKAFLKYPFEDEHTEMEPPTCCQHRDSF